MVRGKVTLNERVRDLHSVLELTVEDLQDAADAGRVVFRRQQLAIFASEGSSGGKRWAPLSEKYAAYKKRVKPGRKILVFSGRMRKSFINRSDPENFYRIAHYLWNRISILYGSEVPYAGFHHLGTPKMPRRDMLQRTDAQKNELINAIRDGLIPQMVRKTTSTLPFLGEELTKTRS